MQIASGAFCFKSLAANYALYSRFLMDLYVPVELQEQSHKVGVQALAGAIN